MEKRLSKCFADNFSDLLEECKLDYRTLAKDENLGINKSSISAYANDTSTPTLENCIKIAEYFGVSLDWLVGRSKYRSDENRYQTVSGIGMTEAAASKLTETLGKDRDGAKWINLLLASEYIDKISMLIRNHFLSVIASHTFNDALKNDYDEILSQDVFEMMARLTLGDNGLSFLSERERSQLYEMFVYMCDNLKETNEAGQITNYATNILESFGGKTGLREMYSAQGTMIMHDLLNWSARLAEAEYMDREFRRIAKDYHKSGLI